KWSDLTLKKIEEMFAKYKYVYSQPKLDGVRCIASKDGLHTRGGKSIVTCLHIEEQLQPFFEKFPDEILDGEFGHGNISFRLDCSLNR
ncbi:hypothetical protein KAU11_12600, partial [Candidatus Babeliales bacterium]|nr:hypothetical protein [Candidatus Babeliales bacterium]